MPRHACAGRGCMSNMPNADGRVTDFAHELQARALGSVSSAAAREIIGSSAKDPPRLPNNARHAQGNGPVPS